MLNLVQSQTTALPPAEWIRRRVRVPLATARLISELAFERRIRTLADAGQTIELAQVEPVQ